METRSSTRKKLRLFRHTCENSSRTLSLLELPIINLYQILSYLDPETLLTDVQVVCKYMRDILKDDFFWRSFRHLSFEKNESLTYIVAVIKKCKSLKHLKITGEEKFDFEDLTALPPCLFDVLSRYPQLRSFSLTHFKIGRNCEDSFRSFMKNLTELTSLCLVNCNFSNFIGEIISEGSSLKILRISPCYLIKDKTFIKIFGNCHLEHLNLMFIRDVLSENFIYSLFTLCSDSLQTLYLTAFMIPYSNFSFIKNCTKLSVLSISCECLGDNALSYIKELKHLTHLELLNCNELTANGIRTFFNEGSFSQLRNLKLCHLVVENSVLDLLADRCQELEHLHLIDSWIITDEGILNVISKCTKLRHLELQQINIIKGSFLLEIHNHLNCLNLIIFRYCDDISMYNLRKFAELNPNFPIRIWKPDTKSLNRQLLISDDMMHKFMVDKLFAESEKCARKTTTTRRSRCFKVTKRVS